MPKSLITAFFGHRSVLIKHRQIIAHSLTLESSLTSINQRGSLKLDTEDTEAPLFILSAGWRSGSTLLQRIVTSDDGHFMWGEPFGDTGLLESLAEPLRRINSKWPPQSNFISEEVHRHDRSSQWIANLYPTLDDLRASYRALFDRLFAEPARNQGATHWGFKEVRLDADHAFLLRWLYPHCKIIFLVRDPEDAFRSYAEYKRWYHVRPEKPVFTVRAFADHWARLAESFHLKANKLDALLIKYEDLISDEKTLDEIEHYLGRSINREALKKKVRSKSGSSGGYSVVTGEIWMLWRRARRVAKHYSYHRH